MEPKRIAVFGPSDCDADSLPYAMAFRAAELIADKGHVSLQGGGTGVMLATARGAHQHGGISIGYTLSIMQPPKHQNHVVNCEPDPMIDGVERLDYEWAPERSTPAHQGWYVRKNYLMDAEGFIVILGSSGTTGTPSEFFDLLHLNNRIWPLYGQPRRPCAVFAPENMKLRKLDWYVVEILRDEDALPPEVRAMFKLVETAEEAVEWALQNQ